MGELVAVGQHECVTCVSCATTFAFIHAACPRCVQDARVETLREALEALNALRSNIVGTQSASWSNTVYPLVAILNAAGLEQFDPSEEQLRQHMGCYGGAGGYPGREYAALEGASDE